MALMHVTARAGELLTRRACGRPAGIEPTLRALPQGAPVAILTHGFRYRPFDPGADPHRMLFGLPGAGPVEADWPAALGFSRDDPADGLCLGFGWDARAAHAPSLARARRNGFAAVYDRAAGVGERLGALVAWIAAIRPDLEIDLFAHSLGARVALRALSDPRVRPALGRVLLLGAAEDAGRARAAMGPPGEPADPDEADPDADPGTAGPQVFHLAARHNDPFDALFEAAAPRLAGRRLQALGRAGLGAARPDWIDLQMDAGPFVAFARDRGVALEAASPRVCHWSFYARPGAMDLHRAILRRRLAWSIPRLRAEAAPEGFAPRWSRLAPRVEGPALRALSGPWPVLRRTARAAADLAGERDLAGPDAAA